MRLILYIALLILEANITMQEPESLDDLNEILSKLIQQTESTNSTSSDNNNKPRNDSKITYVKTLKNPNIIYKNSKNDSKDRATDEKEEIDKRSLKDTIDQDGEPDYIIQDEFTIEPEPSNNPKINKPSNTHDRAGKKTVDDNSEDEDDYLSNTDIDEIDLSKENESYELLVKNAKNGKHKKPGSLKDKQGQRDLLAALQKLMKEIIEMNSSQTHRGKNPTGKHILMGPHIPGHNFLNSYATFINHPILYRLANLRSNRWGLNILRNALRFSAAQKLKRIAYLTNPLNRMMVGYSPIRQYNPLMYRNFGYY